MEMAFPSVDVVSYLILDSIFLPKLNCPENKVNQRMFWSSKSSWLTSRIEFILIAQFSTVAATYNITYFYQISELDDQD